MLNGLDVFSGIGGISYALREWIKPLAYCEIDPYCQKVLLSRMSVNDIQRAPIWDNICSFPGSQFMGHVDIIYGGFPCQDVSIGGTKKGLAGVRSSLIFDMLRLAREIKPSFIFLENVSNVIKLGGIEIIKEINEMGMDCRWACISAEGCGAPHKRDRWFLLAYNNSLSSGETYTKTEFDEKITHSWLRHSRCDRGENAPSYWFENKCPLFGMDYGFPYELDRAKSLGNAVVPQQVRKAFEILMGLK